MIIENVKPYSGQHCETTAIGTLLNQIGIELSEPLLFGLGEGLNFIYWHSKNMDVPFIGGRIKPDLLSQNIAKNLNLKIDIKESASSEKAWTQVKQLIDKQKIVGLKLDCYHLEYFSRAFHFAAHYVAMYGYDEQRAYLVDTRQQGTKVSTSLENLALARAEKGYMASKNLYFTIDKNDKEFDLKNSITKAITSNAKEYLNPPITNISYKGIFKTSNEIKKVFKASKNTQADFNHLAIMMEKAGTGGAIFRNLYRDFLYESYEITGNRNYLKSHEAFKQIASDWTQVATYFEEASKTGEFKNIEEASILMKRLSDMEKEAMEIF